ncbi:kelch repeat and BTB domain-containing protein 11 [Erpetoichthys calabaricus]|uniref:kelch repeat and BTB domain-containing protein 11 n=1 Tax=Erpetoichthys calabaricus TaxID=27687 RepID=UPI002234CA87|nr:kelch repeat and BTB domain-containing protein 11 [Erpetoichthys calabaricus]
MQSSCLQESECAFAPKARFSEEDETAAGRFILHGADTPPVSPEDDRLSKNAVLEEGATENVTGRRSPQESQAFCRHRARGSSRGVGDAMDSTPTQQQQPLDSQQDRTFYHQWDSGCAVKQLPSDGFARDFAQHLGSCLAPLHESKNGVGEEIGGSTPGAACSLSPSLCFSTESGEEAEGGSAAERQQRVVKSQCQINNASATLEEAQGSAAAPVTQRIQMGAEPGGEYACLGSPGYNDFAAIRADSEPDTNQWRQGNGAPNLCSVQEEPDLVIEVAGKQIRAHKSILAEKSDYFKARLSRDILKVKGVSYKTLAVLIDYIYTARMDVSKENVVEVITGAKVLQVPCAVQSAVDAMTAQITMENCYEILTIAKKQRLSELKDTAYRFMSDHFLQVLRDPAVYGRLTGSERDLVLKGRMEGKSCLMVAEINDVYDRVGSRPQSRDNSRPQSPLSIASFEDTHLIYCYSEEHKDWRPLTRMPEDVNTKGCGICTMFNYLFVAGGIRGSGDKGKLSDRVFCYNPVTDMWSETKPLNQARSQLKLVSLDGYLYAIGGECLFTVEKYDPRMDRWTPVAPLPKGAFAVAHEATTCNGEIYVSGGSLFYRLLKYDPKRDEWQECPYNNSRKKSTDMVAFKNFLYRFDVNRDQGVNVFKYNAIVKLWSDCASLRQPSPLPFRCAVMGNCVYCVNKTHTLQLIIEEDAAAGASFGHEPLKAPLEAKGALFPFVLRVPEKSERNAQ